MTIKWQPVVMIINKRLECKCGAMAIFVSGSIAEDDEYNQLTEVDVWCQTCYEKEMEDQS